MSAALRSLPLQASLLALSVGAAGLAGWLGGSQAGLPVVWVGGGFTLAALAFNPRRNWPALLLAAALGELAAHLLNGLSPQAALVAAGLHAAQAAASGWLLLRAIQTSDPPRVDISQMRQALALIVGAALLVNGAAALIAGLLLHPASPLLAGLRWWLADLGGALVAAPILLAWLAGPIRLASPARLAEGGLLVGLIIVSSLLAFNFQEIYIAYWLRVALTLVYLTWAAQRFGGRGVGLAVAALGAVALPAAWHGLGLLSLDVPVPAERLAASLGYLGFASAAALILNAQQAGQERAARQLGLAYTALRSTAAGVVITDPQGGIVWVNPAFTTATGYRLEDVRGENIRLLSSDQHPPEFFQQIWQMIARGETWRGEMLNRRKDGSLYAEETSITPVTGEGGQILNIVAVKQDITQRKRAETALRDSERRYQTISDLTNDYAASFLIAEDGSLIPEWVTDAFTRMTGYTAEEIRQQGGLAAIMHPDDRQRYIDAIRELTHGQPYQAEFRIQTRRGEWRWLHEVGKAEVDPHSGQTRRVLRAARDITERKTRERQLESVVTVSAALRQAGARAEMLPVILEQSQRLLNCQAALLIFPDPVCSDYVVELAAGEWAAGSGLRVAPGGLITEDAMAGEKILTFLKDHPDPRIPPGLWTETVSHVAIAPLSAQRQRIGALWVGRSSPFNPEEQGLIRAITHIAANAIHRAALHEQTELRLQRLDALSAIDQAIASSLDLRLTFDILLKHTLRQLNVQAAAVTLLDRQALIFRRHSQSGFPRGSPAEDERPDLDWLSPTLEQEAVIYSGNCVLPPPLQSERLAETGLHAYAAAPLICKGQLRGLLEVAAAERLDPAPEWRDFFVSLAGQASIALENAGLLLDLQSSNLELRRAYDQTIEGWVNTLDLRDQETENHTLRVVDLTCRLAERMGIPAGELEAVRRGALLHDIGKMAIPDAILRKPGPLDEQEWVEMRKHPLYARQILEKIAYLRPSLDIPACHHEKWDGAGYPQGLAGEQIPLAARIFAVIDVYDALTHDRPYRAAWPRQRALDFIRSQSGSHFDPSVVSGFLHLIEVEFNQD